MQNRTTLTERALRMDASLREEDILLPVDFNLTPTARREHTESIHGVRLGGSPNDKLAHHHRHGQEEDKADIYQDEGRTAITSHLSGETPNVAQSHGAARRSQYHSYPTAKTSSSVHHGIFIFVK